MKKNFFDVFLCITCKKMSSLIKIEIGYKELVDELLEENKKLEEINQNIEKHEIIERINRK